MRAFLSYSHVDKASAMALHEQLEQEDDIQVTIDAIDLRPFASPKSFMESVREHEAVLHLISPSFLRSRNCMRELLAFMKDDTERNHYRERAVPILIEDSEDEVNLFETSGQLEIVDYWWDQKRELEDQIGVRKELGSALDDLRGDLMVLRDIGEQVMRFMRIITHSIYAASFDDQKEKGFSDVIDRLRAVSNEPEPARSKRLTMRLGSSRRRGPDAPAATTDQDSVDGSNGTPSSEAQRLMALRDSIIVASDSDPNRPEFPPFSPRFPATPSYRIHIPQLGREITIKDESHNFTGSHKDRMAWEVVVYYKTLIEDVLDPRSKTDALPSASIISNGSAAVAIQVMLRCYGLPPLKVLLDRGANKGIEQKLRSIGCEVYKEDLATEELDSADVLRLTDNEKGFDVTARNLVDPDRSTYYDWLAYEILNCGAKHIFIPVGTGDLFVNVLMVLRDELVGDTNDRRLHGGARMIEGLELYGATSNDHKTRMDKLYAAHRPTLKEVGRLVSEMRDARLCGDRTDVYDVSEEIVTEAMDLVRVNRIQADESGIAGLSLLLQMDKEGLEIAASEEILVVNTGWLHLP